jgi:hypothetical protein
MPRVILSDNGPQFISEFWKQLFTLLGAGIRLTSTYHPQSNGGQEKFNKTLFEALRTYVSHRQDNWDECMMHFEFAYNNSVRPSTGMSPFILSYAQSPHTPCQFLDTYVALDEFVSSDASKMLKGSGAQLASYLGLDIINNVCEDRDSLHRMTDDFRIRNARLTKPHSYNVGDSVLLSTKNVNSNLPCKKLGPVFVGPFSPPSRFLSSLSSLRLMVVRGIRWKISSIIGTVWVRCVNVSSVGKILISVMTLGLRVNSLLLLHFKFMSSF